MQTITIKAGKERPLLIHHPWVFSGAIESNTDIEHTGVFRIQSSDGHFRSFAVALLLN